ncbi:hypothetical protein BY996DRAFT_6417063 [Phakopsora pachyrhizi]|nr:hypothetical protein BY996DRAFT_6417063 [Phakopsora pachyrhizi]
MTVPAALWLILCPLMLCPNHQFHSPRCGHPGMPSASTHTTWPFASVDPLPRPGHLRLLWLQRPLVLVSEQLTAYLDSWPFNGLLALIAVNTIVFIENLETDDQILDISRLPNPLDPLGGDPAFLYLQSFDTQIDENSHQLNFKPCRQQIFHLAA